MIDVKVDLDRRSFKLRAEIHDAGFICISGPNGSGKTTLLRVISGDLTPDAGHVRVNSVDVSKRSPERREIVLVTPDSMIPHLDVDRHLMWGAAIKGIGRKDELLEKVKAKLGITFGGRVDELSLGMRERVSIATALLSSPKVILVDEAFSNIDHREDFILSFSSLCREGAIDVVHTTQSGSDAALSDHHYTITAGETTRVS